MPEGEPHACEWTDAHSNQGFTRRDSTVSFGTLLEFGFAEVSVIRGKYQSRDEYERVIAVPFLVTSGRVNVDGVEETNMVTRVVAMPPGHYRLVAAQYVVGEEAEVIDLYFESLPTPLEHSSILVADPELKPSYPLIETSEIL